MSLVISEALATARFVASGVPDTHRSLPARELAAAWATTAGTHPAVAIDEDAEVAFERALESAALAGGPLVVAGSLYLVGYLRPLLVPSTLEA